VQAFFSFKRPGMHPKGHKHPEGHKYPEGHKRSLSGAYISTFLSLMLKKNKTAPEKNIPENPGDIGDSSRPTGGRRKKRLFDQIIFRDWCKGCGICIAFCPKQVYLADAAGKPLADKPDNCIGCRFCELHCPELAITVKERFIDRRRKPDGT
jgi:2-oxoglutarate ferredoxin oxidoreductase subunit delta